jgi:hypothetical protein
MFAALGGGLLWSGRLRQRQAKAAVAGAIVLAAWSMIRTSAWLVPLDLLAASFLLVVSVAVALEGDLGDISWPRFLRRVGVASARVLSAPSYFGRAIATGRQSSGRGRVAARVLRGLVLAGPLVALLVALLASADAVFAHLLQSPIGPADVSLHAFFVVIGVWAMTGLLSAASKPSTAVLSHPRQPIGAIEAIVVLGSLVTVFLLFAVAQLVALSESGHRVIETAGLTYAEYARSGYFQLLAAAAITFTVLVGLRALADVRTPATARPFLGLAHTAIALTLVIVVVALRRLDLYESAFGLTMLRLYGEVFAWWIAVVFLLLALSFTRRGSQRAWLPLGAVGTGLVALLVLNVVNPEAAVVRRNLDHFAATGRFDSAYLEELSADALPTIVDGLDRLDSTARAAVLTVICGEHVAERGIWSFNLARERAESRLSSECGGR